MPDSAEIDEAIIGKLVADGALTTLMPHGVFKDIAGGSPTNPPTRFVIVTLMSALDDHMFNARAFETAVYLVKAVEKGMSGLNADNAAARIDQLLEQGTLSITGYSLMALRRTERIGITEVDEQTGDRWQHRGGLYEVVACSV